ncbi:hypothetical protein EVAR_18433_1 [Eumeta japonica]|uniref:Uncharacterized protein n=1 Tax=Eumeta variegata TaxID=151549 RepID=A0A4C1UTY0_EUMVA|nr:hypothetical protein EVAR_18433_1 [Eumeta japonica]
MMHPSTVHASCTSKSPNLPWMSRYIFLLFCSNSRSFHFIGGTIRIRDTEIRTVAQIRTVVDDGPASGANFVSRGVVRIEGLSIDCAISKCPPVLAKFHLEGGVNGKSYIKLEI